MPLLPCPNKCDGELAFDIEIEENDSGDGVWFQSWTSRVAIYNKEDSYHEKKCPKLTQEQIDKATEEIQKQIDSEPVSAYDYVDEP